MVLICSPANGMYHLVSKRAHGGMSGWADTAGVPQIQNKRQSNFIPPTGSLIQSVSFRFFKSSMKLIFLNLFFLMHFSGFPPFSRLIKAGMQGTDVPCPAPRAVLGHTPAHTGSVPSKYPELRAECGWDYLLSNLVYKCSVLWWW